MPRASNHSVPFIKMFHGSAYVIRTHEGLGWAIIRHGGRLSIGFILTFLLSRRVVYACRPRRLHTHEKGHLTGWRQRSLVLAE